MEVVAARATRWEELGLVEVQDIFIRGEKAFMAMPADVRARFNNDPISFMDFCSKAENLDEMRKLGLAVPKKEEPAAPAPVVKP